MNKKAIIISIIAIVFFSICIQETDVTANEDILIQRGDTIEISGRLLENITYGNPVPNQILEFYDQTENQLLGFALTDVDGYATITWSIPINHTLGNTILNVTFRGNESLYLSSSCQYMLLTILSQTNMQVQVKENHLAPHDFIEVEVYIENDKQDPIQNATLHFCVNDTIIMTTITNSSGHGHFSIECNDTWLIYGENAISILYNYDLVYYHSNAVENLLIIYDKISTFLTVQNLPNTTLLNETHEINLQFWSELSTLSDIMIEIQLNGALLDTILVNDSVSKLYNLLIDENFGLGPQKLSFVYSGTPRYSSVILERTITVFSSVYLEFTIDQYPIIDNNQSISIDFKDLLNRPIPNASVVVKDMSTEYVSIISPTPGQSYIESSFPLYGQIGPRTLQINVTGNDYLTNNSLLLDLIVWAKSEIIILESSILGYASPSQEISFQIQLVGHERNCSACQVDLTKQNGSLIESRLTDDRGSAVFVFSAPSEEGNTSLIIVYSGNLNQYELPYRLFYNFSVSLKIPLTIKSFTYSVIPALQEIQIQSQIQLLNGSYPTGLNFEYDWNGVVYSIQIAQDGIIFLHLVVPTTAGYYSFQYWIDESTSTYPLYGEILIELDENSILASQGVGIPGIAITVICTTSIAALPIIRRWYILG